VNELFQFLDLRPNLALELSVVFVNGMR